MESNCEGLILYSCLLAALFFLSVMLVSCVFLIGSIAIILAIPFLVLWDLLAAVARLFMVLGKWMRVYRTRLTPVRPERDGTTVLMQISDLHVSASQLIEAETRGLQDGIPSADIIANRLRTLLAHYERRNAPLLITGDITDRGTDEEWDLAEGIIRGYTNIGKRRVIAILGNHDLNIGEIKGPRASREAREVRRRRGIESLRRIPAEQPDQYPHIVRYPETDHTLILLDSNIYETRQILSNAIGMFGRKQLAKLERILAEEGDVIVAAHHHIALHTLERATVEGPFLVAIDGPQLLELLAKHGRKHAVLFVHGHKHQESFGVYERDGGRVLVYEHPSSTRAHLHRPDAPDGRVTRILRTPTGFSVAYDRVTFEGGAAATEV